MTNKDYLELLTSRMYIEMLKNNIFRSLEYKRYQGEYTELAPIGYKNIRNKQNSYRLYCISFQLLIWDRKFL